MLLLFKELFNLKQYFDIFFKSILVDIDIYNIIYIKNIFYIFFLKVIKSLYKL